MSRSQIECCYHLINALPVVELLLVCAIWERRREGQEGRGGGKLVFLALPRFHLRGTDAVRRWREAVLLGGVCVCVCVCV